MTMKQTQTKLFSFGDIDLDFSVASKNFFPDRFKKMLVLGYNQHTVASVSVSGNQVTLNYGVTHGYTADRVLKVNSGALAAINGGEFWIDAVTATSVTLTIDSAPTSILGGFTTKIASLGYSLVYEQGNVHVYKFKALDDSDLFLRLCFQDVATSRNCVSPCIGKSYDEVTGVINDPLALNETRAIASPTNGVKWEFQLYPSADNSLTYSQAYAGFGKAVMLGSIYHLALLTNFETGGGRVHAILPNATHDYTQLDYPLLIAEDSGASNINTWNFDQNNSGRVFIGNIRCILDNSTVAAPPQLVVGPLAAQSFLSPVIDAFNTTTASPIPIYEYATSQFLGFCYGMYLCMYSNNNRPSTDKTVTPAYGEDIHGVKLYTHYFGNSSYVYFCLPIEEIKIDS